MRTIILRPIAVLMFLLAAGLGSASAQQGSDARNAPGGHLPPPLTLATTAFSDGGQMPAKYDCEVPKGASTITPPFEWSNAPKATVSFVLILHDLDDRNPPSGTVDVAHWLVYNIPATVSSLPEGIASGAAVGGSGVQGKNNRGESGYQAPCPPKGAAAHHYLFELYAMDSKLDLPAGATRADLLKAMDGHVIGKSNYVGKFQR